ncbi:MAG: DUF4249 domain-containing protein [Chitinophagaceae bacterium]
MFRAIAKYYLLIQLLCMTIACRKPYQPAVLVNGDNYLVVDGFVNIGAGGITNIILSRTKNLADTVVTIPERGAQVQIQDAAGNKYTLTEQNANGNYVSTPLNLNNKTQFKILITTAGNKQYISDLVDTRITPPIDSISWEQDTTGVHVFANTHDLSNKTRYYRWQYVLTWEYDSQLETPWGLNGNKIYARDVDSQIHVCYNTTYSKNVLLGNSAALTADVISKGKLFIIPQNDSTLAHRMSILVMQYALTPQCYAYWQIIQKNSEQLGTLFDLQPSQLEGNIHSISNPNEPVVGFISAGTMEQKRIFISKDDVKDWKAQPGSYPCAVRAIPTNPVDFSIWSYQDDSFVPWYFSGSDLMIAKTACVDCRLSGGTTVKPSFW